MLQHACPRISGISRSDLYLGSIRDGHCFRVARYSVEDVNNLPRRRAFRRRPNGSASPELHAMTTYKGW